MRFVQLNPAATLTVSAVLSVTLAALGLAACIDTGSGSGGFFGGDVETGFGGSDGCFDTGDSDLRYADFDHDGFGDPDSALSRCDAPDTWVAVDTDCNDGDGAINPDAVEVCGDEIDQDCDGNDAVCEL